MVGSVVCALLSTPGLGQRRNSPGPRSGLVPLENSDIRPWSLSTVLLQLASLPHSDGPGTEIRADGLRIASQDQSIKFLTAATDGKMPYKCSSCSKSFVDSSDLLQHQHTQARSLTLAVSVARASARVPTCSSTMWPTVVRSSMSVCNVAFASSSNLSQHQETCQGGSCCQYPWLQFQPKLQSQFGPVLKEPEHL
ncbi:zinc finger protein 324B-like [Zalophus californianus]|uniref:Zinc finger protein 324B-like n=1 Tax=Zalophus californianus TaxID=9704 RepID=A0A6J2EBV7_ZALCA|nr:zinc finger protein 324B-like [Zalophus californianus]